MATDVAAAQDDSTKSTALAGTTKTIIMPDPVYEFCAPKFYDFATNSGDLPSTERADAWFDTAATSSELYQN